MRVKPNKTDKLFSDWIRERDGWRCQRCGGEYPPPTRALHACHFHRRGLHATRYDPDNVVSLCMGCHLLMDRDKRGEFADFMGARLGSVKFEALDQRAKLTVKKKLAEAEALEWLTNDIT